MISRKRLLRSARRRLRVEWHEGRTLGEIDRSVTFCLFCMVVLVVIVCVFFIVDMRSLPKETYNQFESVNIVDQPEWGVSLGDGKITATENCIITISLLWFSLRYYDLLKFFQELDRATRWPDFWDFVEKEKEKRDQRVYYCSRSPVFFE